MKRIAFLSNGCQGGFSKPRELIAADPHYREVVDPTKADVLMVNFCAISTESIDDFGNFRRRIIQCKEHNPKLKIVAGGCVEGLAEKKDLSFADVVFHHQGELDALMTALGKEDCTELSPSITGGAAAINIAQGCSRRCSFCKVHFLKYMHLKSRPIAEILDLVQKALAQGVTTIILNAENSTEYGIDLGTNLQALLEQVLALEEVQILDVHGLCLDEVSPSLLQILKHPKIRMLQLEVQSLNDQIRKNMNLRKTKDEALAILDALSDKFLVSNFMSEFPGHSIAEFNREMRLIRAHHMYYLSYDVYDDTPGTPSHEMYQKPDDVTVDYYRNTFLRTVANERKLLLEQLMRKPYIKASVTSVEDDEICLYAMNYAVEIRAKPSWRGYRPGELVRVKVTGLHDGVPVWVRNGPQYNTAEGKQLMQVLQYFDAAGKNQFLLVNGEILGSIV